MKEKKKKSAKMLEEEYEKVFGPSSIDPEAPLVFDPKDIKQPIPQYHRRFTAPDFAKPEFPKTPFKAPTRYSDAEKEYTNHVPGTLF